MIAGNRGKEKYIYTGLWINAEKRQEQKFFNFAVTSNPNKVEVTFERIDGITGDLFIKTISSLPFNIDDIVIWRGYGEGQRYNVVQVTEGVDENIMAHQNFRKRANQIRYIQLRRAG
jgi:hypothetical protein